MWRTAWTWRRHRSTSPASSGCSATDDTEAALAEWTGTPLAGLDADGLCGDRRRARRAVAGGRRDATSARRVEADAHAVIGSLTELTATYPFREGLWALLMTALYRVGRQADALAAYRRAREHLVEGLGVEPGPRLRELEALILGHDEQLGVDRSSTGSAVGLPSGTVTFGFCDVEDSTRLWAAHRREMAAAMARHDELVAAAADRHGGYVFATGGDSFGVAFHRASDAAGWAIELQAATSSERWPGDVEIRLRIGLHTGETEERGKGYFGPAVIVAAQLAAAGHGGQTLVSGVTSGLLDGSDLRDLGTYRLDGVVAEQRIFQLGDGEHPPLRIDANRGGNLPRRLGRLIGRDDDLEIIDDALATSPIVTLVGPGGIGKTRLALAVAQRRRRRQQGRGVAHRAGRARLVERGAPGGGRRAGREGEPGADVDRVDRGGAAVPPGAARPGQLRARHRRCGRPRRRRRRGLPERPGARHVEGGPRPARRAARRRRTARTLRARASSCSTSGHRRPRRTFDPDASRDDVEEICRRLDGIPLAIELAAARTRSLSPAELVERLDDRLRLLTGGRRASVERHRTLRATIQWSYDLLTPPQQAMFRWLSIFAGPFDRGGGRDDRRRCRSGRRSGPRRCRRPAR